MKPKFPVGSQVIVRGEHKRKVKKFFYYPEKVDDVLVVTKWVSREGFNLNDEYHFEGCRMYLFDYEITIAKGQMELPFKFKREGEV